MEEQAEYGQGTATMEKKFAVYVLSRGSQIDSQPGAPDYLIKTYTMSLSPGALNAYVLAQTNNSRECYTDGPVGDAEWAAHQVLMMERYEVWRERVLQEMGAPEGANVVIKQIQAEYFAAVWIKELN